MAPQGYLHLKSVRLAVQRDGLVQHLPVTICGEGTETTCSSFIVVL